MKAWLKYNQLGGYHAQQRRKFVCNKITLTTFLASIALKRCLSMLFLSQFVIPVPFLSYISVPGCQLGSENKGAVQMARPTVEDTVDLLIKVR